jgi:hypothetical protein
MGIAGDKPCHLPKLKLTLDFLGVNILSREPSGAQEVNEGGHEAHLSMDGTGPRPIRATMSCLSLEAPMLSIFISLQ